jgi:hypothetical protein
MSDDRPPTSADSRLADPRTIAAAFPWIADSARKALAAVIADEPDEARATLQYLIRRLEGKTT